nr:hypothetical protein [uncultured Desulfobulbus sp.]
MTKSFGSSSFGLDLILIIKSTPNDEEPDKNSLHHISHPVVQTIFIYLNNISIYLAHRAFTSTLVGLPRFFGAACTKSWCFSTCAAASRDF